ncbi:MAG: (2Fe-2S) ferredoxin domain-containing protein [Oscillospiraceae bacterium]|nr:(2Fe-2S) ferredoxin domain-containing protein [Oscillospiraceae bacterium]
MAKTIEELRAIREKMRGQIDLRQKGEDNLRVVVGMATCGIAAGARPVLHAFTEEVRRRGLNNVTVGQAGCIGLCQFEPIVEVYAPDAEKVTYVNMDAEKAARVVAEHLVNNRVVAEYTVGAVEGLK